jgi:hypothetical protein
MDNKLTTYEELTGQKPRTKVIETSSGNRFKIQSLPMLEMLITARGAILREAIIAGATGKKPPETDDAEVAMDPALQQHAVRTVCRGVISLDLVDKIPEECNKGKRETSVYLLPPADFMELYSELIGFSASGSSEDLESLEAVNV